MRRKALLALTVGVVFWLSVASNLPAGRTSGADWARPRTFTASGVTAVYPRSWHAFPHEGSTVVSSFAMPADWPDREQKRVPDGGVYIMLWSYGPARSDYPAGRRPFELRRPDYGSYECRFKLAGYRILFTEDGRAMQAMVALGRGADEADALGVLNRL
jgi:hypothetical protein